MTAPRIFTITIAKNEDVWIGPTLDAWAPFAEKMLVMDTGSSDQTLTFLEDWASDDDGNKLDEVELHVYCQDVGASMVARHMLIERVPKEEDNWIVLLDADEVYAESQIRELLRLMQNPDIDYIGVRPIPIGWDGKTCFYYGPLEPFDPADKLKYTTQYWCPKVTIRAFRSTRLDGICDPRWGKETLYVRFDEKRHHITDDFKMVPGMPDGCVAVQFSGRVDWQERLHFCHMSLVARSSKWKEIGHADGALDRCRRAHPASIPLPDWVDVPESVKNTLAGLEKPF